MREVILTHSYDVESVQKSIIRQKNAPEHKDQTDLEEGDELNSGQKVKFQHLQQRKEEERWNSSR